MNYLLCTLFGFIGPVNNMLNVTAGERLGTARGALVNYAEASVLSLLLLLLLGYSQELRWEHIVSVPLFCYLGSVCGLLAMGLIITSTSKTGVVLCSVCLMTGSMVTSTILDYVFYDLFSLKKVLGIVLILTGMIMKQLNTVKNG